MSDPSDVGLAPGLLVAAPSLGDPNFAGSVVLMAQHTAEGALGFVVNRPAPVAASEVLAAVDDALSAGRASASVLLGGPVTPERLWILYRSGVVAVEEDGLRIGGSLALGGSRNLLRALVREPAAGPFHMVLGCAGWGPMQVEREVTGGAWLPLRLHEDLVFEVPFPERWGEAVRRLGLEPGSFTMGGGGAQA